MYDPVGERMLQDTQDYRHATWLETQRHNREVEREQAAMRGLMESQARMDLARLQEEQMVAAQSRTLQKMVEVFQKTMAKGTAYFEEGAYPAAIAEFKKAKDDFTSGEIRALGAALDGDDRSLFSNDDFLRTTRRKWEEISPDYYYNMSLASLQNKDFFSAIASASPLIEKEPHSWKAYNLRAKAEIRLARRDHTEFPERIVQDLDASLLLSANQETIKARRYFVQGDFPHAIRFLELALKEPIPLPERIELLEFLGDAYIATKNIEKALEAYELALKNVPDHLQFFEQIEILRTKRGDILLGAGREEEAFAEYRKAHEVNEKNPLCFIPEANGGAAEKQFALGVAYYNGTPAIKRNWTKAKEWFLKCAEKKDRAKYLLGWMHEQGWGGANKNLTEAVRFYRESTEGDGRYSAGLLLLKGGEGLAADPRQALECLRYAADHATPKLRTEASFKLGTLLSEGEGVERSFPEAFQRYQFVADSTVEGVDAAKKTMAAYTIGVWYLEGRDGVPKNLTMEGSFKYLPSAHRAGYAQAKAPYARLLFEAAETYSQDKKNEVLGNYTKAADLGHAMAAYRAGELYRLGASGIAKKRALAKKYLQIAVDHGVKEAKASLEEMNSWCTIA